MINVVELLQAPGTRRSVSVDAPLAGLSTESARIEPTQPVHFQMVLEAVDGESVHARGAVSGKMTVICRRCLAESIEDFKVDVSEVYRPERDVWDPGFVVVDALTVDLEVVATEGIALAMPAFPLCRPDCAGLCTVCGADLNEGECGCDRNPPDVRWGPLKDLIIPSDVDQLE